MLSKLPVIRPLLRSRWFPFAAMAVTLAVFVLAIASGWAGTPAGNRNFGIVFVWIVWWALLMLLLVPAAGRLWCGVCPIPGPGEWLQRRTLVGVLGKGRLFAAGRRWPKALRNIWLQNVGFLGVALFSAVILTTPQVTAWLLFAFVLLAVVTGLLYERRVFCRYICPVGGFIGLYSQVAPVEIRPIDRNVCAAHTEKTCYTGSEAGYGCPWMLYPGGLTSNTYCGMCTECLKTCPKDNMALFLRKPGADLVAPGARRVDEAYKALIMLACAFIYSAVLIGPWGGLKDAARAVGTGPWFAYAGAFLVFCLALLPGLFWLAVRGGQALAGEKNNPGHFADYAVALVPLGLAAWMAFSLSFVLANLSYAWSVVSDPMGWGWNLFGSAGLPWTPYLTGVIPFLQVPVMLAGLIAAVALALRTARGKGLPPRAAAPVALFCTAATLGLLTLLVA